MASWQGDSGAEMEHSILAIFVVFSAFSQKNVKKQSGAVRLIKLRDPVDVDGANIYISLDDCRR